MIWNYNNGRIFSVNENNELLAETTYISKQNGEIDIDHTYVSPGLRGQGLAGDMMKVVVEFLKENGLKASATCSYANAWLKKHSETYPNIISKDIDDDAISCKIDGKH
jgi:predicted GNAT family acetyltransferase